MIAAHPGNLIDAAARLDDDAIQVWYLDYRPAQGRQPLRLTLAAYLGIDADAVTLVEGEHGRPRLDPAHGSSLDFNWSHSGEHALIAVARGISPGIDIERRRPRPRALPIARRFFGNDEADALAALPEEARDAAFLEIWTAKEAILKAHGRGIGYGLQRLRILSTRAQLRLLRFDDDDVDAWQLQRLAIAPDLVGALAWRGAPRTIQLEVLASTS
ncbi:4-phosphopantetheinyl transferase [Rhodanobacter sp. B05]|uniref:4'-phosphopantetheinyl transferase family protein n=1 Tax=Rhodanobacter sp. B05 TaxID=1945859 RepID=UPI00098552B4|nr:4'-phosphopantetheinyl transferase superfamily protein [Rhodanobacter sp. B05]OOG60808.1 4-phosphopantetheinyl transferase [Rhodanobacter sp. B05]